MNPPTGWCWATRPRLRYWPSPSKVDLKGGIDLEAEVRRTPRLRELPFESRRKRMSTVHQVQTFRVAFVKGGPKEVLALCSRIQIDGQERPLLPLTVIQVLSIDLGTDMVPAIGLGAESAEAGVMDRPPRSQREPLLNGRLLARALLWYGMIESLASMSAYFFFNRLHGWPQGPLAAEGMPYRMATTMTLAGVVATQVGAVLGCRTERASIFKVGFHTNRLVLLGIAVELILLGLLVYVPFLQDIFNTEPIGLREWAFVFAWTPVIFLADEGRKVLLHYRERRRGALARGLAKQSRAPDGEIHCHWLWSDGHRPSTDAEPTRPRRNRSG